MYCLLSFVNTRIYFHLLISHSYTANVCVYEYWTVKIWRYIFHTKSCWSERRINRIEEIEDNTCGDQRSYLIHWSIRTPVRTLPRSLFVFVSVDRAIDIKWKIRRKKTFFTILSGTYFEENICGKNPSLPVSLAFNAY